MVIDNNIENESQGLTASQVEDSRNSYGMNILTPPNKTSMWRLYLEKYKDPIIQILLVAAVISLIMACVENDYVETFGIFLAIFFATTVGFYFERDAAKKFNLLTKMDDVQNVKVKRDGHVMEIPRKDVVVGDLIKEGVVVKSGLKGGEKIIVSNIAKIRPNTKVQIVDKEK